MIYAMDFIAHYLPNCRPHTVNQLPQLQNLIRQFETLTASRNSYRPGPSRPAAASDDNNIRQRIALIENIKEDL
jgi:hypothetical protein